MTQTYFDWDASWTTTSIDGTMTDGTSQSTAAISNDGKVATEISVDVDYDSTANEGLLCYVLRDINGTDYETANDSPFGFQMPYAISQTRRRTFTVAGDRVSRFKVQLQNNTGGTVTATVKYRQAVSTST